MPSPASAANRAPAHGDTIAIGLSGGVDSAVAALLLREQGFDVFALFMKNWEEDDTSDACAAASDLADARAVAERIGIPLYTVNFATEYWDYVFTEFLDEYRAGRTPNPDVLCNREIKFKAFLEHALALGATGIATGHYARVAPGHGGLRLQLCADPEKDQTYFLHLLDQRQLSLSRFPLAGLTKAQVRGIAARAGFENAKKRDSTGICFIGERRFRDFLSRYLPVEPGPIETPEGRHIGEHCGVAYYTIGQRQGLGIGGVADGSEAPWFVACKDPARNLLIAVQGADHPLLLSREAVAARPHWIAGDPPGVPPFRCRARLRHRQPLQNCVLLSYDAETCWVRFDEPQRAVTPGQAIVFYRGNECLGGAVLQRAW